MPHQKSCPLKFGTAVNSEGILIEVPCCRDECAWWFDNRCAVLGIVKELCLEKKRGSPKGIAAD
jgi:hypothetical protein